MYDFDAYEAVDDLIDEINDEYAVEAVDEGAEAYQQIYDELCERVECEELTLEEAEIINDAAAEKYLSEAVKLDKQTLKKVSRSKKKTIAAIKKQYRAAKTPAEYQEVCRLCDNAISDVDVMIKDVRETKETNADRLDYIGREVVSPAITQVAVLGVAAGITGTNVKAETYSKVLAAGLAGKAISAVGGAALNKAVRGKKDDKSGFATYKSQILGWLRYEKQIIAKIKKKAAVKAAVN